jgi:hypothetical protein
VGMTIPIFDVPTLLSVLREMFLGHTYCREVLR